MPDELRARTAARLVELIRAADTHLGTGFLATPYLLPVLADTGHLDVAYELLHRDTPPSWLTMVERGATTVWEEWEGIADDGSAHASLNHYSKGAVISFLHSRVAGIQLLDESPAYRRFRVAPAPGGGITWAEAIHDAPVREDRIVVARRAWSVPADDDGPGGNDRGDPPPRRDPTRAITGHRGARMRLALIVNLMIAGFLHSRSRKRGARRSSTLALREYRRGDGASWASAELHP